MKRVLQADAYDALELMALAFGGIGGGKHCESGSIGFSDSVPWCVVGMTVPSYHGGSAEMRGWLTRAGIDSSVNDLAVQAVNMRKGRLDYHARISFEEWCGELNVTRGAT